MANVNESIRLTERCQCPQHCRTASSRHPEPNGDNPEPNRENPQSNRDNPEPNRDNPEPNRENLEPNRENLEPDRYNPAVPDEISQSILEALTKNLDSWEQYFSGMIIIAIFGGQITFTIVLSDIYDPRKVFARESLPYLGTDKEKVRVFVALAFLFFSIALGAAAVGKIVLANPTTKTQILRSLRKKQYSPLKWLTITACCIDYFPMLAFLFLGFAVSAYVPGVGFTVVAIVLLSLLCKMYSGHVVMTNNKKSWYSVRLVAASSLWQESS